MKSIFGVISMSQDKLKGKIALVTGGTSGIGGASAMEFARQGATVIATARNEERGKDFEEQAKKEGLELVYIPCDVTDRSSVEKLKEQIKKTYGRLDILMQRCWISTSVRWTMC